LHDLPFVTDAEKYVNRLPVIHVPSLEQDYG
jgi:hypothetical protein